MARATNGTVMIAGDSWGWPWPLYSPMEGEGDRPGHVEGGDEGPGDGDPHHGGVALVSEGHQDLVLGPEPGERQDPRQGQGAR